MKIFNLFKKNKPDSKKLSGMQVNIEHHQSVENEERRIQNIKIKHRIVEISKSNYQDYSSLNIVAFSYALGGAMGEGGGIYIITIDGKLYHTNIARGDMTIDDAIHICPPLADCRFCFNGAEQVPEGWIFFDMGFGNYLFVKEFISKEVKTKSANLEKVELFQQWKAIVMEVLKMRNYLSGLPTDPYTQLYEKYIEENCNEAIRQLKSKELNLISIHAYIRHIPIRGFNESTEHALRISEGCLKQLYEYSKEMNYIPKDYSYEDFITYHQLSLDDIIFLKNGGTIEKGKYKYVWENGKPKAIG